MQPGDVMVLMGRGPMGTGMEEMYQLTAALRHLPWGKHIALITDARFSGVSTGACIGHVGPEALAGGPLGKLREGDTDPDGRRPGEPDGQPRPGRTRRAALYAADREQRCWQAARRTPTWRPIRDLPDDTRLWAALQNASGGTWGGCVYDVDAIVDLLTREVKMYLTRHQTAEAGPRLGAAMALPAGRAGHSGHSAGPSAVEALVGSPGSRALRTSEPACGPALLAPTGGNA